jgi:uncharacterized protein (DUF362 family)
MPSLQSNTVYFYRLPIDKNIAPFDTYQDLARTALEALDFSLPDSGPVLLKPNATVLYPADQRIITHPGFLAGMLDALLAKGVERERLVVAEGQSGENPKAGYTWEKCGYAPMLRDYQVPLQSLNDVKTRSVDVPDGVVYQQYNIATEVTDCALFINVPLAKCHNLGCTTLSIKNLMGIVTSPQRHLCATQTVDEPFGEDLMRLTDSGLSLFEDRFYHKLCDLLVAVRQLQMPRLCVVDGLIGRDGTAFNEGNNYPLGWTLIGDNEVHVDAVATYLMGLDPQQTPYLRFAADRGLGTIDAQAIQVTDLSSGAPVDLEKERRPEPLMPISRGNGGYYNRFRADGTPVPWRLDDLNEQRQKDGLEPISAT